MKDFLVNVVAPARITTTFTIRAESTEHASALAQALLQKHNAQDDFVVNQQGERITQPEMLAWGIERFDFKNPVIEIKKETNA